MNGFDQMRDDDLGREIELRERREMADPVFIQQRLSNREKEVLTLVADGKTTAEIAQIIGRAYKTVDCHRTRIAAKLGVHGTALLTRYAVREGLVTP